MSALALNCLRDHVGEMQEAGTRRRKVAVPEIGPSLSVFKDIGAKEQSSVFHPAGGERAQAGFVHCAVPRDRWAKEVLMRPYDATFTVGAQSVLLRREDTGLPLQQGQL